MENTRHVLDEVHATFMLQKKLADAAVAQLTPAQLFHAPGPDDNSVAVLLKHVGGNLRSRWTEPFTTDGEKPDRDRDSEFVVASDTEASVRQVWDSGWAVLDSTFAELHDADLQRTVRIRGEELTLAKALLRSLAHTSQHVGQVILLARHLAGNAWQTLSIPRGRSAEFLTRPPG